MKIDSTDDVWGLDEALRLPVSVRGWDFIETPVPLSAPRRRKPTSAAIGLLQAAFQPRILETVHEMVCRHPDGFAAASERIAPEAWRLLFYRGFFVLESLTAYSFHANQALRQICALGDVFMDPPPAWLGTTRTAKDISDDLDTTLRELGDDAAVAAWVVLAMAQRAHLTKAEVLRCRWWDPVWIRLFAERVQLTA